jgi:hypothetical protein
MRARRASLNLLTLFIMLETKKIKEWRQWGKDAFRDVLRAENKR